MEISSNFSFNMPQSTDTVDISKLSDNWDNLDTTLADVKTRGENTELFVGSKTLLKTDANDTIVAAINEVDTHSDTNASKISKETTRATGKETELENSIDSEVTRATTTEQSITKSLNEEVTRAKKAEETNATKITNEISRAKSAESTLTTNLSSEVTRATDAESTLTTNLNSEITRAKAAEKTNSDNLTTEITRARNAEYTLTTNLNSEISRAKKAEEANTSSISTLSGKVTTNTSDISTLKTTVASNTSAISTEKTRATGVEGTRIAGTYIMATNTLAQNDTALDTQVKKNTDAIATLNGIGDGSVSKQVSDGIAKIVANAPSDFDTLKEISDWISTHSTDATAMNTQISSNKANIATNTSNISAEVTRAKAAEKTNADAITTETTRAKAAEKTNADAITALTTKVTTNTTNISTLTTNLGGHTIKSDVPSGAKFTDTVYDDTALAAKVTTNTNNISTLTTNLNNEITRAKAAESTNATNITAINGKISNINNTSDADKPISTKTQAALDKKQDAISDLTTIRSNASTAKTASEANAASIALINDNELLNGIETYYALRRTGKQYSVQVPKHDSNQSSTCTKIGINADLKYVPSTDTDAGTDDYENIPLFQWVHVIYKRYEDGSPYPIAIEGTAKYNELLEAGACDVGAMQMSFYVSLDHSNDAYDVITISDLPFDGAVAWSECRRADGTVLPWCIGSSYFSSLGDDKYLHSLPNRKPERFQSYNNMVTNYPKKGKGYQGAGTERWTFSYIFMTIKGGTKNIQNLFQGCTNYNFQYTCAVAESDVKRVIMTTSNGNNFVVGASVQIGTSGSNNDRGQSSTYSVTDNAVVLSKESVTISGTEYTAINLDLDSAITTTTSTLVSSIHWRSGSTDKVISHRDGSYSSNTDAKHPFRIQGREYLVGGWSVASDTMFWLTSTGRDIYVWTKGTTHVANSNTGATKVGTIPFTTDGWIGDIGFDTTTGAYWFSKKGSSSATGIGDYFYAGGTSTNTLREYLIGGPLWYGTSAGLYLSAGHSLSSAHWAYLAAD